MRSPEAQVQGPASESEECTYFAVFPQGKADLTEACLRAFFYAGISVELTEIISFTAEDGVTFDVVRCEGVTA